ncbi:uncharacterized protein LOC133177322 [Saccostrea echinata]|uniref:uncharacterized protein LOC133177322 n=1 Tax=Saccostrea echinata TaxID=191078 RepID=UPI002A7EB365|nr:uncharacterized protein LOC133177322 [Saccostrea echinata]
MMIYCLQYSEASCDGPEKCCVGFKWDEQIGNCTKCDIGYTGRHCGEKCPYPTYGEICQQVCECNQPLCDFSTGCKSNITTFLISTTSSLFPLLETTNLDVSHNSSSRKKNSSVVLGTSMKSSAKENRTNDIFLHPIVLSLFSFNIVFIIIIVILLTLVFRKLYCRTDFLQISKEEIESMKMEYTQMQDENQRETNIDRLIQPQYMTNISNTVIRLGVNDKSLCKDPSENAEYTDPKSMCTEMTSVTLSENKDLKRNGLLQFVRRPCQSVDENVYMTTDTLTFEGETETKTFLK